MVSRSPMIEAERLERLVAAGRRTGSLTLGDLKRELPVEAMDVEDLALVVAHLEERGISVDLDPDLAAPHPDAGRSPPPLVEVATAPSEAVPPRGRRPAEDGLSARGDAPGTGAAPAADVPRPAHRVVIIAGVAALALLVVGVLFAIA